MEEAMAENYWCYQCSQVVTPVMDIEIKCPFCQGEFIEQMSNGTRESEDMDSDVGSDRALSLWAPILLGMMGNPRLRTRFDRINFEEDDNNGNGNGNENVGGEARRDGNTDLDRELESIVRRISSATVLQLLHGIRDGMSYEVENSDNDRVRGTDTDTDTDTSTDRDRERAILFNPFNQTIFIQGSYDRSLGDYFMSHGLDLLLRHLVESEANMYGTPPARREAIEALPVVKIEEEMLQCAVCLDDLEAGVEAKEMPCKHKFHSECILPWLELHGSCPICRYQMPADESKLEPERPRVNANRRESEDDVHGSGEEGERDGRLRFSIPWILNGLFSTGSRSNGANSSSSSYQSGSAPQRDDN